MISYQFDVTCRFANVNDVIYTFDANGNLLSDGTNTYAYDSANRLVSVTNGQSSVTSYTYNGLGDRLSQTVDGVTTNYTLDLNAGLTQVLDDGTNAYIYGNGRIAQSSIVNQQYPSGTMSEISYFLGDALGSVRQMTDETGTVTLARTYDPYGNVTSTGGTSSTAYGFTGETTDANGLVYLRAQNDKKSFIKTEKPRPFCEIRVPLILILLLANAGRTFRFHLAMPANEVIISESCLYNIPQGENS